MRGDGETFHHQTYSLSRRKLESLEYLYGPVKELVRFTVCETIPTTTEAGYDGYLITSPSGEPQFPTTGFLGYEHKNKAHIQAAIPYEDLSEHLLEVNEAFAPKLAENMYRCNFSTEVKIADDGNNYFIDLTARAPEPPGSIMMEQIENLGEFMYHGAAGELREIELEKPFGVQVMLYSSWAKTNWQTFDIPDDIRRWVKVYNSFYADGATHAAPREISNPYSDGNDEVGSVVGLGDTIQEAIDNVREYCGELKAFDTDDQIEALGECLKRIHAGEEEGVEFPGKTPKPSTIIED